MSENSGELKTEDTGNEILYLLCNINSSQLLYIDTLLHYVVIVDLRQLRQSRVETPDSSQENHLPNKCTSTFKEI